MSVTEILEEIKLVPTSELEALEASIRLERLRRGSRLASAEERRLLQVVHRPMPWLERFNRLQAKWQDDGLDDNERAELLSMVKEREARNVERVEAVQRLSELRSVPFRTLWKQLMGEAPAPIVPFN